MMDNRSLDETKSTESASESNSTTAAILLPGNRDDLTGMETADSLDFDADRLAQDPVLAAATHPVVSAMHLSAISSHAAPLESDLSHEIDHFIEEHFWLNTSPLLPAVSAITNDESDVLINSSNWHTLGHFESHMDDESSPSLSVMELGAQPDSSTSSMPLPPDPSLSLFSPVPEFTPMDCPEPSSKAFPMHLQPSVEPSQALFAPRANLTAAPPPSNQFRQRRLLHAASSIVGPESEQMKVVIRMIVYLQETISGDFCDGREYIRRQQVLWQLRETLEECLAKHWEGCSQYQHLPGSFLDRMVGIMERDEWLHVFTHSKTFVHARLDAMGATPEGTLSFNVWSRLLWNHATSKQKRARSK